MEIKNINRIVSEYNKLCLFTEQKVELLETLDREMYNFEDLGGIASFYFEEEKVCVECYDGIKSFPLEYLTMDENDLKDKIIEDKNKRFDEKKRMLDEKTIREKVEREAREFKEYVRLKEKFKK